MNAQPSHIAFRDGGALEALQPPASRRAIAARLAPPARPKRELICLECATPFQSVEAHAEFCCTAHRQSWNNRRMKRGAQLYDLVMAMRFDRGLAAKLSIGWTLICTLASAYRDADNALRGGRRSWRRPQAALDDIPSAYGRGGDGR